MNRGVVVIVDFPFSTGEQGKIRPALVVQNDRENRRLNKTIIAMITGNLRRAAEPTHWLIDPSKPTARRVVYMARHWSVASIRTRLTKRP